MMHIDFKMAVTAGEETGRVLASSVVSVVK